MSKSIKSRRLVKELASMESEPTPGVICYQKDDSDMTQLEGFITGPPDSPYENGRFKLDIQIPQNYPISPPQIRFHTKVYHPNIDEGGRICLDILKKGSEGSWSPSQTLMTTLLSLIQLLGYPNPDDPLDVDIAKEFQLDYPRFMKKAKEWTLKYANGKEEQVDDNSVHLDNIDNDKEGEEQVEEETSKVESSKKMLSLSRKKRVPATLSTLERQEHNKKVKLAAEKILNMESLAAGPSESNVDKYKPPESQANDAMNKSEINLTKTLEREDVGAAPLEETIASKYKLPPLKSSHKNTATSKNNKKGSSREKSKVKPVEAMEEDEEEDSIVLSSSQYFTSKKKEKSLKFAKNSKNESSINDDIIDISSSQESTIEPQITSKVMNKEDEKEVQTKQDQQVQEMKEAPMKENLMEEDLEEEGLMEEDLKEEDLKEEGLKEEGSKDDLEPTTKQVDHATPPEEKVAPKSTKRQRFRPAIPDPKYHAHKTDEKPTKEEERGQDGGKEKTTAPEIIDVEALTEYAYSHNKYLMNYKPLRNMIIVSSEDENGPPPPQKKLRLSLRKK